MPRIFVSYSHGDRSLVEDLIPLLREVYGLEKVWFDENIPGGQDWWDEILRQIAACKVFLFLISDESLQSEYCQRELAEAQRLRKSIIPILVQPTDMDEIPQKLGRLQIIDMSSGIARGMNKLHAAITKLAAIIQPSPPHPPGEPNSEKRRLEAAMPEYTRRNATTQVMVKIVMSGSKGLRGELPKEVPSGEIIQKGNVRGSTFPIQFPTDQKGQLLPANLCVEVTSPAFDVTAIVDNSQICSQNQLEMKLPPNQDSRTAIFNLTPHDTSDGYVTVTITIYQENQVVAQTSVSTQIVGVPVQSQAAVRWNIIELPLLLTLSSSFGIGGLAGAVSIPPSQAPAPKLPISSSPTSVPNVSTPPFKLMRWYNKLNEPLAIIMGAFITGVFGIFAALVAGGVIQLNPTPEPTLVGVINTPTASPTESNTPTVTPTNTSTATPTVTFTASHTPTNTSTTTPTITFTSSHTLTSTPTPSCRITIVQQFAAPGRQAQGITWDGTSLWLADNSGMIFNVSPSSTVLGTFRSPKVTPEGTAWTGSSFWIFTTIAAEIDEFQVAGRNIVTLQSFKSPNQGTGGTFDDLAWDGQNLWYADQYTLYYLTTTGTILNSLVFGTEIAGMDWDGTYLWIAHNAFPSNASLNIVDTQGTRLAGFVSPVFEVNGLAWGDGVLWAIGRDTLGGVMQVYQLGVACALQSIT